MIGLRKLRRLSGHQARLLAGSIVLLPAAALSLRLFRFGRVRRWFRVDAAVDGTPVVDHPRARETARMVAGAAHYGPYRATCLPQSLVLHYLLRRQGLQSAFVLGVGEGKPFPGHSWVEHDGAPLIDSPAVRERFTELRGAR
jgi:hypothetical protein